jgi:hypothetical protein
VVNLFNDCPPQRHREQGGCTEKLKLGPYPRFELFRVFSWIVFLFLRTGHLFSAALLDQINRNLQVVVGPSCLSLK